MRRGSIKSTKFLIIVLIVSLDLIGVSYASWTQGMDVINGVSTGEMDVVYEANNNTITYGEDGVIGIIKNNSTFPIRLQSDAVVNILHDDIDGYEVEFPEYLAAKGKQGSICNVWIRPVSDTAIRESEPAELQTIDTEKYVVETQREDILADDVSIKSPTYVQANLY